MRNVAFEGEGIRAGSGQGQSRSVEVGKYRVGAGPTPLHEQAQRS